MPNQRTEYIVEAFMKAVTRRSDKEQRLRNGLFLRTQFHGALQQGIVPIHPRWEWLRRQSRTMLELLIAMAVDYDKAQENGSDRASVADLMDIAQMTVNSISGIIQTGNLDPVTLELLPYEEVKPEITYSPAVEREEEPDLESLVRGEGDDEDDDE